MNTIIDSKPENHWKTVRALSSHLWPSGRSDLKGRVLLSLFLLLLAKLVNLVVPFFYKLGVDALSAEKALITLPLGMIVAYGGARLLYQSFGELRDFVFIKVGQHAQRTLALNTFKHLHKLSLRFHLDRQTGGLTRVIERGTHAMQSVLSFILFSILPTLLELLMVTGVLFYKFNLSFAAVTFFTIFFYIVYTLCITEWRIKYRRRMNEKDNEASTKAIDSLLNYETVKYFNNEEHEYRRFDKALAGYEEAAVQSQSSLSLLNIGQGAIISVGLVLVMVMAAEGVVQGNLTIGDFVLVNTFLIQLYMPLNFLGYVYREIKQSLIDMDKMFDLLEEQSDVQDDPAAKPLIRSAGEIEFDEVYFGYQKDRAVLKGISFKIPAGQTYAIVGPSGAGKSTISRLLFRFYDTNQGSIRIDGQDISEITQGSLREAIGIVPQDTVLFNDSIGYNIGYGAPITDQAEVLHAARLAQVHDFIETLPQGYQTPVGERGLKLSGGEKQRVAIARTILKDPLILLFDEATSALDSHTEKEIQASMEAVSKNRTTLVIAHRLSTVVDADQIMVLKDGRIVEQGRHHELLLQKGEYAELWTKQQEAREMKDKLNQMEGVYTSPLLASVHP